MTHPKYEQTLVVLKPDAVQRSLIGEIIQRFERVGLKLVAIKMFTPSPEFIEKHYTLEAGWLEAVGNKRINGFKEKGLVPPTEDPEEAGNEILTSLKNYMTASPVVAMVWQGAHVVPLVRKLVGGTEPHSSDVGTIRGDFVHDSYVMSAGDNRSIRNLIHASGSASEAANEIPLWFKKEEIIDYKLVQEAILYDVNMDGKGE